MIAQAVAAMIGAFAALLALAEIQLPNKWLRYFVAFLIGLVAAVLLAGLVQWLTGNVFAKL